MQFKLKTFQTIDRQSAHDDKVPDWACYQHSISQSLLAPTHDPLPFSNYKTALEVAKRKGYFIPILAVFLNQLEHEHAFYSKESVEKLFFPQEGETNNGEN